MNPQTAVLGRPNKRLVVAGVIVLMLALLGFLYYQLFVFHITKTDPDLGSFSSSAPYLRVSFNQTLDAKSLQFSDPAYAVSKASVEGKSITFDFDGELIVGKSYEITIKKIANKGGRLIENRKLRFTAQKIPASALSAEQQKALVSRQDHYPYTVDYISYVNFDTLTSNGMSIDQLQSVKQSLYSYSVLAKQEYWTMTLVPNSVQVRLHDNQSDSTVDSQSFSLKVGKATVQVTASYDVLDDSARTQIYDQSGTLLYDSASH